jgi:uncharacterized protein (TIGR03435 family)
VPIRAVAVIGVALIALMRSLPGQQSGLQFEVASVRPTVFPSDAFAAGFRVGASSNPCGGGKVSVSGTLIRLDSVAICDIIRIAYDVKYYQVIGVPATLGYSGQDRIPPVSFQAAIADAAKQPVFFYDIEARSPGSDPPKEDQVREMLRALLADRFHLTLHRENREFSYYALVPAKNGPKLTPAVEGCKGHSTPDLATSCGQTMERLVKQLNGLADRTVLDMTGYTGKFDYEIPIDRNDGDIRSAILASLLEHLKLKLEPRKGPVECLVIDHVERPSEN